MHLIKKADDVFAVIPVLILLLLTPWPMAMMIASAIGLVAGWVMLGSRATFRSQLLASMVGFALDVMLG